MRLIDRPPAKPSRNTADALICMPRRLVYGQSFVVGSGTIWSCARTVIAWFSLFVEVIRHLWPYELLRCALFWEVWRRELFRKYLFFACVLEIDLLQSLTRIHGHRWSRKTNATHEALRCLKAPVLLPRRDKAHSVRLCLNIPCINLPQFWGVLNANCCRCFDSQ